VQETETAVMVGAVGVVVVVEPPPPPPQLTKNDNVDNPPIAATIPERTDHFPDIWSSRAFPIGFLRERYAEGHLLSITKWVISHG
jgi:hypothetical protein